NWLAARAAVSSRALQHHARHGNTAGAEGPGAAAAVLCLGRGGMRARLRARGGAAGRRETQERQRKAESEPRSHQNELSHDLPIRHNFVTLLSVVASVTIATLSTRTMSQL